MSKHKLQYVIHNPNTAETTAKFILDILIDANADKVDKALKREIKLKDETLARHLA